MCWKNANNPPKTKSDCWSNTVIVFTNYHNVFDISYYGNKKEGCWQRPSAFLNGEKVVKWIERPTI